jgi:hypothetical protein
VPEVTQAIRQILVSGQVEIVDKIRVVEGYTYLIAQRVETEHIPENIGNIVRIFGSVDGDVCDPVMALQILKIVFAIIKSLHSYAPSKLSSPAWEESPGRDLAEWMRDLFIIFSQRFSDSFEIMEVISFSV